MMLRVCAHTLLQARGALSFSLTWRSSAAWRFTPLFELLHTRAFACRHHPSSRAADSCLLLSRSECRHLGQ